MKKNLKISDMKAWIKKLIVPILVIGMVGCAENFDLNINDDPNNPSPDKATVENLFNSVQLNFVYFLEETWDVTSQLSREQALTWGKNYREAFVPQDFDLMWRFAYADVIPDARKVREIVEQKGIESPIAVGGSMIIESYVLTTLVDLFGDVPYSEAIQGSDNIAPKVDAGKDVYAAALQLLQSAVEAIGDAQTDNVVTDLFYGNDAQKWKALAYALMLRIYNNTRLVDPDAGQKIKEIVDGGHLDNFEDFQFQYGTNRAAPDSRHPLYDNWYESSDGDYMSNYLMWLMRWEKDSNFTDPRIRFYFYRQDLNLEDEDPNVWECVLTKTPFEPLPPGSFDHYLQVDPRLPYCIASVDGYFGRDHGNGSGIPPDGPVRTTYGVYPAGGSFDNNSARYTQEEGKLGAKGQGIQPILLKSFVLFMRAEAALTANTGEDPGELLKSAVEESLNKVQSFSLSIIPQSELEYVVGQDPVTGEKVTAQEAFIDGLDTLNEWYVNKVMELYNNSSDKLDVIIKEFLIAAYGNGIEGYNMYRRTGRPNNMPPLIDPNLAQNAVFPRSLWYPANSANLNANVSQKPNMAVKVFWDANPDPLR